MNIEIGSHAINRRSFFGNLRTGMAGIALASLLEGESHPARGEDFWSPPSGRPHFAPRAKNVIWLFMVGGVSHVESFDPKPALTQYAGKTIAETPHKGVLDSPYVKKNLREFAVGLRSILPTLYPLQVGFQKRGQSGIEVADWWPHVGGCIDDIAVIRSMWTTDNDHGAQLQFHTGRHVIEGPFPTIGSWIHYGLGSLNENLPRFVVLGNPLADCCGGNNGHGASYLGPEHDGVRLEVDPRNPIPFAAPDTGVSKEEQAAGATLLGRLNQHAARQFPDDAALLARIKSYELAYRMQTSVPEAVNLDIEPAHIRTLYGLDDETTRPFAGQCLAARRLVERGVRFVQVFHGSSGSAGDWDAHRNLRQNHEKTCAQVDRPIAGLLRDLKQRGLFDETLVVWATEFGRTPGAEGGDGRDHHPYGFSIWMAGGGIKGGIAHGATDELGFHAVEDRHYVTDVHATVMKQLGLDSHRLELPSYRRLEVDHGKPIQDILA